MQVHKAKYKINEDFNLIILCKLNGVSIDIIDYLLSKYHKKNKNYELYVCALMFFLDEDDFIMLELLLKHGLDINETIYYNNNEYNLFFYLINIKETVSEFDIQFLISHGININSKLDYKLDNDLFFFNNQKCNITDLIIHKIVKSSFSAFNILIDIFSYYYIYEGNLVLLKKNINSLNKSSYKKLVLLDCNQLKITKLFILYCFRKKEDFYNSIFYKNLKKNAYELNLTNILSNIETFYSQDEKKLEELRQEYEIARINHLFNLKDYKSIKTYLKKQKDDDINKIVVDSKPLLIYASQYCINDPKMFDLLLNYNFDKNIFDND